MLARRDEGERDEELRHWLSRIDPTRVPKHLAIIMDGNGRWARQRHMPRTVGHIRGAETVRRVVRACRYLPDRLTELAVPNAEQGVVRYLTLYTFSNENWSRPKDEVWSIMHLIEEELREHLGEMQDEGVSIRMLGRESDLPATLRDELQRDAEATSQNHHLAMYLALNYGGRNEIVDAARRIAEQVKAGELLPEAVDEALFARHLYAPEVPDPELLIRTGGDLRVSNFLLWQIAYAELWVTPTLWPAFEAVDVYQAIAEFQTRERRFGGVTHGTS
ncbi:MAG: di-trans,poly-cis-decaprenylcistransferase [Armatimonadetes bacterium]|nr:di-trans,poly-cis-decaprenylcistransferase [Armatimonadota bacterium]